MPVWLEGWYTNYIALPWLILMVSLGLSWRRPRIRTGVVVGLVASIILTAAFILPTAGPLILSWWVLYTGLGAATSLFAILIKKRRYREASLVGTFIGIEMAAFYWQSTLNRVINSMYQLISLQVYAGVMIVAILVLGSVAALSFGPSQKDN